MTALRTLSLLCLSVALGACSQIDTGNVGVERTLGKVGQEALPPGLTSRCSRRWMNSRLKR